MTELGVVDWPRSVGWYRDVLGLAVLMLDEERRFALLGDAGGRIALKAGAPPVGIRLAFEASDLNAARLRIEHAGESPTAIVENAEEGFRSFCTVDPQGVPIEVFAWISGHHTATSGNT
jgi:predicted enzyme related to lactoylglutathione lyase